MEAYAIRDWTNHFETYESRKVKHSLSWVSLPTKHDGKGYRRLVAHPKSVQVFCAFVLMVEVAAKMPTRGVLADGDGPLSAEDLSLKTGYPAHIFEIAFEVLRDPKIGWLEVVLIQEKPGENSRHAGIPADLPNTSSTSHTRGVVAGDPLEMPLWKRIKVLAETIEKHQANPESTAFNGHPTKEQRDELVMLKATLKQLKHRELAQAKGG